MKPRIPSLRHDGLLSPGEALRGHFVGPVAPDIPSPRQYGFLSFLLDEENNIRGAEYGRYDGLPIINTGDAS